MEKTKKCLTFRDKYATIEKKIHIRKEIYMAISSRIMRAAAALIICIGFISGFIRTDVHAANAYIWDGKTELRPGYTYYVLDTVRIRNDVTIPEGAKISVRDAGTLKITSSGKLTVCGELSAAIGGTILNYGKLNIKAGGKLNVYGSLQSSISASMGIAGSLTVYNRGKFETSSEMKIYKGSELYVKGIFSFYRSSDVKLSGNITTAANSTLELRGIMSVSVSGTIDVNGHLTVGSASDVRCSGRIVVSETSTYTRFKPISLTKSGRFIDRRPEYKFRNMTVDILIDEPNVFRKGIDVSYAQGGSIDWQKVAESGVDFAIIRAARGYISDEKPMIEDIWFRRNIEEAQKYGIDVGVYFYSYASTVAEARAEAEFFVETIKDYRIQYPVILDMEEQYQGDIGKKKLTNMIDAFFEVLMENNYFPMFYSYKAWIETYLDMNTLDKYAVWLAQVSDTVTYDGGYYIWQYSFTGKVSGIESNIDLDYSYKDWPEIFRKYHLNNM